MVSRVTVNALCPWPTEAGFQAGAAMEDTKLVDGRTLPGPAVVAKVDRRARHRGVAVGVVGLSNKVPASSARVTPRPVMRRLAHRMQEAGH